MALLANRRKTQENVASAAYTSTTNILTSDRAANHESVTYYLNVTAVSGTTPSLTAAVQTSPDDGTTWFTLATAEMTGQTAAITATGQYRLSSNAPIGARTRCLFTISGTTPSFTITANAIYERSGSVY